MARERSVQPDSSNDDANSNDDLLRPKRLRDVIGQRAIVERMEVLIDAARKKREVVQHILFDGPPGLGKTTLATVLPKELDVELVFASGPALRTPKDVMPYLTNLSERAVLFIDEIHRMPRTVEEFIYPAMEDFRIDIVLGEGLGARTMSMPLKRFTLIGATTRSGLLSGPMRDRFMVHEHFDYYSDDELATIVVNNARKLKVSLEPDAAREIACRCRGTPRIANSLLHWVRSYAISKGDGTVSLDVANAALAMQEIDKKGLDGQDRRYLDILLRVYGGGPAGVASIAATMNVSDDTLSEDVEPFLLRCGFIIRTPSGRRANAAAAQHLGIEFNEQPEAGFLF